MGLMILEEIAAYFPDETGEIVVGVSGGPDSLCLIHQLLQTRYPIAAAYFHHRLRPEADEEARFVEEKAAAWGIPFLYGEGDVAAHADQKGLTAEEAARSLRYQFLFSRARTREAQAVAVGHTADDQVETVLMNILRGSGLQGLTGMATYSLPNPWSDAIPLVRPLLSVWGDDVRDYCRQHRLDPVYDASNQELTYRRNRIRHQVLPLLEEVNPNVRASIWQLAEIMRGEYSLLRKRTAVLWEDIFLEGGEGYLALDLPGLLDLELGDQRRLLRQALQDLVSGLSQVSFVHVEKVRQYLVDPRKHEVDNVVENMQVEVYQDRVWIFRGGEGVSLPAFPQVRGGKGITIQQPGSYPLDGGWLLEVEVLSLSDELRERIYNNQDPYQAWLDAGRVSFPLGVQGRNPGDRISPLGMEGEIKVADLMINEKIPHIARDRWPLVRTEGEIVWVPGCRIAHAVRIRGDSKRALHLTLKNVPS